jgi:hypothetical protein
MQAGKTSGSCNSRFLKPENDFLGQTRFCATGDTSVFMTVKALL